MKEIMSDSKTKTYFIIISAKNLIYDYLVVIVVPYKGYLLKCTAMHRDAP